MDKQTEDGLEPVESLLVSKWMDSEFVTVK